MARRSPDSPPPPPPDGPRPSAAAGKVVRAGAEQGSQQQPREPFDGAAGKVLRAGAEQGSRQQPRWRELARLGRAQDGAFGVDQLYELGLSADQLALLVAQARFVRRHRGVYADALVAATRRQPLVAALLALGPEAFLSRRTALAVLCVRPLNLHQIEVTVAAEHTPRHRGIIVHRTTIEPLDTEIRVVDGLRVASPALALVEVAHRESDRELDRLVAELCRRRRLAIEQIDAAGERRRGVRGLPRLRAALQRYRPPEHEDVSGFERAFAAWIDGDPEIPPPERNVRLGGWEFDFHWPRQRVVAETDGDQYHRTPAELERDRVKDAWCQAHDIRMLRVTEFRFAQDRAGIRADLRAMLALADAA